MSTLSIAARSIPVAITGWLTSANTSAIGGLAERKDTPVVDVYSQVLKDEGLEHLWQFLSSSILTNTAKEIGLRVPEQLVMIPGKLAGSIWHWAISSRGSLNRQSSSSDPQKMKLGFFDNFHENILEGPSNFILKNVGLDPENPNLPKYFLTQLGGLGLCGWVLKKFGDDNLPGINLNSERSQTSNILNGLGYMAAEQVTYLLSHTTRFYIDFKDNFQTNRFAKSLANVVNEKFIPGHAFSALAGAVSTSLFGEALPKATAAALGEMPLKLFNRIANAHRRKATKKVIEENGKVTSNHILSDGVTGCMDSVFQPIRNILLRAIQGIYNVSREELEESFQTKANLKVLTESLSGQAA